MSMLPNNEYIIDISPPSSWFELLSLQKSFFKLSHEDYSIAWGHLSSHCGSLYLDIVFVIEGEAILGKDESYES